MAILGSVDPIDPRMLAAGIAMINSTVAQHGGR
jgi:hypothetical protein